MTLHRRECLWGRLCNYELSSNLDQLWGQSFLQLVYKVFQECVVNTHFEVSTTLKLQSRKLQLVTVFQPTFAQTTVNCRAVVRLTTDTEKEPTKSVLLWSLDTVTELGMCHAQINRFDCLFLKGDWTKFTVRWIPHQHWGIHNQMNPFHKPLVLKI